MTCKAVTKTMDEDSQLKGKKARPGTLSLKSLNKFDMYDDHRTPGADHTSGKSKSSTERPRAIKTNSRIQKDEKLKKDMYLAFVKNALQQKYKGDREPFDELVSQFDMGSKQNRTTTTVAQLRLWLSALSHVVTQLDHNHSALVHAVLNFPWSTLDAAFAKTYVTFVGMLVNARPEYLTFALDKCVLGLTHQLHSSEASQLAQQSSDSVTRGAAYDRYHALLQHLMHLIPTLPTALQPILIKLFPHKRLPKASHVTYIRNLLRIILYCPSLLEPILSVIIERVIQIDVEIQVELEELEEEDNNQETAKPNEMFELDPFDTDVTSADPDAFPSDESGSDGEGVDGFSDVSSEAYDPTDDFTTPTQQEVDLPHIRDMMQKLDAVMETLFEFFGSHAIVHTHPTRPGSPNLSLEQQTTEMSDDEIKARHDTMFYTLLGILDRVVLRTLKSKYTQFLVFWYTSLDPNYLDLFQGMLISKAFLEVEIPLVIKVAATSYIASFVSRAAFVDKTHTRHIVNLLKQHLEDQLMDCEAEASLRPNTSRYATFYSVAQAMFLIFCFRWRDLADDTELDEDILDLGSTTAGHRKWIAELDILRKIVHSVLNPLKICSQNVVNQFAKVAHRTGFLYVYPIMEANRREDVRRSSASVVLVVSDSTLSANLNTFFPFDPYRLPLSHRWIDPIYREWSAVAVDDDDDEEEEGEEEESEDDEVKEALSDGLGASFEAMSISPARGGISAAETS